MGICKVYFVILISMLGMILIVSEDEYQQFYTDMLTLHNKYRAIHGAGPLVMKDNLSRVAAINAARLDDVIYLNWDFGINTYYNVKDAELDVNKVFFRWYNKEANHNYSQSYNARLNNLKTRQFSQIVWKNTTELGVAVARTDEFLKVVAVYSPRGNTPNEFKSNVSRPQKEAEKGNADGINSSLTLLDSEKTKN